MPPSENFRESLKAGRLQDALLLAMGQAVELKITTWVASAADLTIAPAGHRLQTRIDLVQGDIENEVGDRFLTRPDYASLRQFHHEQVAAGNRTIRQNLNSLQQLFAALAHIHAPNQEQLGSQSQAALDTELDQMEVHQAEAAIDPAHLLTLEDLEPVDDLETFMDEAPALAIDDEQTAPAWAETANEPELPMDNSEPDNLGLPPSDWSVDETGMPTLDASVGLGSGDRWSTEPDLVLPNEAEDWGEFVEFVEEPEESDPYPAVFEEDLFPPSAPTPYRSTGAPSHPTEPADVPSQDENTYRWNEDHDRPNG